MTSWDVEQYERYKTYRDRPALDLMVQIPADLEPREIWDLGCGAGEHAALLARRRPAAKVYGLDASSAMLDAARARHADVVWIEGDIAAFAPQTPPDLIFTNAALQWVPDHAALFPRLVAALAPGGVFACQMPLSARGRWRLDLQEVAAEEPWADALKDARGIHVAAAEDYWRWLSPLAEVDIWSTDYLHVLTGYDPVVEWVKGSSLRPYLDRLEGKEHAAFLEAYAGRLRKTYPRQADGATLLDFARLFIVARRG